ncbi:MAG: ATP-binding protein [Ilumatobacteraceae bacterium]
MADPSTDTLTGRSLLRGVAVYAWITWAWSTLATALSHERVERAWLAIGLLGAALVVNILMTRAVARPHRGVTAGLVIAELAVGYALLAGEGWVFSAGQAFAGRQGIAGGWPVVGVITTGVLYGPRLGIPTGIAMASARVVGVAANGVRSFDRDQLGSLAATFVFYAVFGGVAGWVGRLLRQAEREVVMARAREEFARTMHDTVLQTLALTARRTADSDPVLARLARDTDREVRLFLYGPVTSDTDRRELTGSLRQAAVAAARPYDLEVTVSGVGDRMRLRADAVTAVAAAVSEAITNVGKHADASRVTVFAEEDDGEVFVTVRDDGIGFDPVATATATTGRGLSDSIIARMSDAGGRADVVSAPGRGTEVRLWIR